MNFLIGTIMFVIGFVLGVFTRNILMKVISVKRKIELAEEIVEKHQKEQEFKKKYDISIDDDNIED